MQLVDGPSGCRVFPFEAKEHFREQASVMAMAAEFMDLLCNTKQLLLGDF